MNVKIIKNLLNNKLFIYAGLYFYGAKILTPIDKLSSRVFYKNYEKETEFDKPPVFIVGLPRSGTTLVYQYLSLVLDVSYISLAWSLLPRTAPCLKSILFSKPPADLKSFYGNGKSLKSPHEGGSIFQQWFPDQIVHYVPDLDRQKAADFISYFKKVNFHSKKNFLIKNGRLSVCIHIINKLFPDARFIRIKRDLVEVSLSILRGREILKGDREINWTVTPKEWPQICQLPYPEQVVQQVYYINKQIEEDLKTVASERITTIDYRDFCERPFYYASEFVAKNNNIKLRASIIDSVIKKKIAPSRGPSFEPEIIDRITSTLNKMLLSEKGS